MSQCHSIAIPVANHVQVCYLKVTISINFVGTFFCEFGLLRVLNLSLRFVREIVQD